MTSTYSPKLRLNLMGNGDQSGTWGSTTNINLGTLLEQGIAGYASVNIGGLTTYTLTAYNGVSDESRAAVILLTGTLVSACDVVCPSGASFSKLYYVHNGTSGGYSIVFKTASGSGVTIPAGARALVFCDGTNVINQLDGLSLAVNSTTPGLRVKQSGTGNGILIEAAGSGNALAITDGSTGTPFTVSSTGQVTVNANTSNNAFRITQTGSGNSFVVEDSANPDSTSFIIDNAGNVGIGNGNLTVGGYVTLPGVTTESRYANIGTGRSGNGASYVDLVGDATYTSYGLRLIRNDSGANTNSELNHRGTGLLRLRAIDAGSITLETDSTERFRVGTAGQLGIAGENYGTAGQVLVSGGASAAPAWADNLATTLIQTNAQTGTTYTLAITDSGKVVSMSNSTANTITVPANATAAIPIGAVINLISVGTGQTTISPAGGVTMVSYGTKRKLTGQYSMATLIKNGTDSWYLAGDLTA